ncbi:MAG: T9SS type A sorting domain-containing protein [candidate division WOR-3 bacterium]|nr:T9SS type A sorting domain-containing protein [candidate division WOR-3 bacterium]
MSIILITLLFSYPDSARVIGRMYYYGGASGSWGNTIIARDKLHRIHFVYSKKIGLPYADSSEIYYRYSTDNGNTWSLEENISRTGRALSAAPCLVIDNQNVPHCFWKQYVPDGAGVYELFHCKKDTTGWTIPTRLTYQNTTTNATNYSSAVVDSLNCIRLVWDAPPDNFQQPEIWYSVLTDTSLTIPYNVTNSPYETGGPCLGIDTLDYLHLSYDELIAGYQEFYKKYDNVNWYPPYYLAWQLNGEGAAVLRVDTKNRIHCILSHRLPNATQDDIFYLCYTDTGGWSYPINISETPMTSAWYADIACDSFGNLYVAWQERLPGYTDDIYYRTFNGVEWSPIMNLTNDPNWSGYPRLSHPVTRNGVDLVWSHEVSFNPQVYDVVYMRLQPIASAINIEEPETSKTAVQTPIPKLFIFPNPCRTQTTIRYSLTAPTKVSLQLYDISGRLVKTLVDEEKKPGNYSLTLNTKTLCSGVYFLSLEADNKRIIERLVVIK